VIEIQNLFLEQVLHAENTGLYAVSTLKDIFHRNQGRSLFKTVQGHMVFDKVLALQVGNAADAINVTFILVEMKCPIMSLYDTPLAFMSQLALLI
jgi:hypothetical protein